MTAQCPRKPDLASTSPANPIVSLMRTRNFDASILQVRSVSSQAYGTGRALNQRSIQCHLESGNASSHAALVVFLRICRQREARERCNIGEDSQVVQVEHFVRKVPGTQ